MSRTFLQSIRSFLFPDFFAGNGQNNLKLVRKSVTARTGALTLNRKLVLRLITVTLCAKRQMFRLLCKDFPAPETKSASLLEIPPGLTLLCAPPGHIRQKNAIFVAGKAEDLPLSFVGERCAAVLDSANSGLRAAAAKLRLPALTCGMCGADTLTVSSWRSDSAVISLLRPLTAFDGSAVEPFELPVAFEIPPEPFDLLACAAVFCLMGRANPLNGLDLWTLPS